MSETILKCINIKKSFVENYVLKGINFEMQKHEVICLIGASGSGKSTLLRCINLLDRIDDGQIFLNDEDISDPRINQDIARAKIGIVFQSFNLFPHMTVLDNVSLGNRIVHKIPRKEADEISIRLLERIGLKDKIKKHPDRLSGGQQQRVAIVRAIASNPDLLLLDEITSALDPLLVGEVLDLVSELKEGGSTILMATHEMEFARKVSDKIFFLDKGKIAETGTPDEIFNNPKKGETRTFLASI
ncbi:MAG: amino acid ABC transporter ATP-binding protein [Clostridiales Family XIII bacterium]|jgi:polar amino acid transport system ATP-binding protein|nr:amino acid ABC transporter ATP-binding protein [Clostridiales Family XIII bacterium]